MDSGNSSVIDTSISASPCDLDLCKAGFPENALHKSFECCRTECLRENCVELVLPFLLFRHIGRGRILRLQYLATDGTLPAERLDCPHDFLGVDFAYLLSLRS